MDIDKLKMDKVEKPNLVSQEIQLSRTSLRDVSQNIIVAQDSELASDICELVPILGRGWER